MKALILSAILALASASESALAACSGGGQIKGSDLTNLLAGKTVCATLGADKWQEEHMAGGALYDYKKGPLDPVDPRTQVGTWTVSDTGSNTVVTYSYTAGGTYSFKVFANGGGSYDFCGQGGASTVFNATLRSIGAGC